MPVDDLTRPGPDEIRDHFLARLNDALRRPGMWGNENALRLYMDAVAFVDGRQGDWQRERDALRKRDAFAPTGVLGAIEYALPGYRAVHEAVASVYTEVAWRLGWVTADPRSGEPDVLGAPAGAKPRTASVEEHQRLRAGLDGDWDADRVVSEFGPPTVLCGGTNDRYGRTLCYATDDPADGLVCLHFESTYDWAADHRTRESQPESPPILVATRYGDGSFRGTFTMTEAGAVLISAAPAR